MGRPGRCGGTPPRRPRRRGTARTAREPLPQTADVVIVGGGYTGLWTAYYLLRDQPGREVLVLEAEHVGFGASGRNGGWVRRSGRSGPTRSTARYGRTATLAQLAALRDTVDEVGRVDAEEGLGAGFVKGGALVVARTPAQEARARVAAAHSAVVGRRHGLAGCRRDPRAARRRRRPRSHLHPPLRPRAPAPAGRRPGRRGAPARRPDRRGGPRGARPRPRRGARRRPPDHRRERRRRHRGLDGHPVRAVAAGRTGLLADGGHRADRRRALGADRPRRPRGVRRPRPRRHLRAAHRRRPDRLRGSRRAVPLGQRDPARVRRGAHRLRRAAHDAARPAPPARRHRVHARLGRPARHRPRLAPVGDLGPGDRVGRAGGYVGDGVAASNLAGRTLADLVSAATPRSPHCPGSATARRGGSTSRCAGSASTPACSWPGSPTARRRPPAARPGSAPCSTGSPATDPSAVCANGRQGNHFRTHRG